MSDSDDPTWPYNQGVEEFAARFEASSPDELWAPVGEFVPVGPGRVGLDIGAGVGRDAGWLRSLGLDMVAVEPAEALRLIGQGRRPELRWIDDRLPDLAKVHRLGLAFDLVMLSAAWMHLRPAERPRAFRKITTLLKPGGVLLITLRHGPADFGRIYYEVSLGEIEALARDFGLSVVHVSHQPDVLGRDGVEWTTICLRLPDDGTAGLPLIRGVILNDSKSSTYKLSLLRAVAKIADAAPSMAISDHFRTDDRVAVPLGLVALNWLRAYLPLVSAGLPQLGGNSGPDGLGFAGDGFRALLAQGVDAQDLRIGASFRGERARAITAALREARRTIVNMPVRYTTLPNTPSQVFEASGTGTLSSASSVTLSDEVLWGLGRLAMPGHLWRTMQRHGVWIEPLIVAEWARMIRGYAEPMGLLLAPGTIEARLAWREPDRDTALARNIVRDLQAAGSTVRCVWSGDSLSPNNFDIDHTIPWSVWSCGDLWNLAPASRAVNQREKRDRLPDRVAMAAAREGILDWWDRSWRANPALAGRFAVEARAALPIEGEATPEAVFGGLEWRRLRLELDQQPPSWAGVGRRHGERRPGHSG